MSLYLLALAFLAVPQQTALPPPFEVAPVGNCSFAPGVPNINPATGKELVKREWLNLIFTDEADEEFGFRNYNSLRDGLSQGDLIYVPDSPQELGINLRTEGKHGIGGSTTDRQARVWLRSLRPEGLGLLLYLANEYRNRFVKAHGENWLRHYRPLELTSLVRSRGYQRILAGVNANADVERQKVPPTHVYGIAFDITRKGLTGEQDRLLLQVLTELEATCSVMYFPESKAQATFHVIALPQAWDKFRAVYESLAAPSADGSQRNR